MPQISAMYYTAYFSVKEIRHVNIPLYLHSFGTKTNKTTNIHNTLGLFDWQNIQPVSVNIYDKTK